MPRTEERPVASYLRELATRCRQRASLISADPAAATLREIADDLESIADRLERNHGRPASSATRAIRE